MAIVVKQEPQGMRERETSTLSYRTSVALAACLALLASAGSVRADIIIDENFDAAVPILSGQMEAMATRMDAGMWIGGNGMGMNGRWMQVGMMGNMMLLGDIGSSMMVMMAAWNTIAYFEPQPRGGWQGMPLVLSFDHRFDPPNQNPFMAMYGVYGWSTNALIPLSTDDPGVNGLMLMADAIAPGQAWGSVRDTYFGDLSGFDFIGVTFTFGGDEPPPPEGVLELFIDNVRLSTIPEPATMMLAALGMGVAARLRRRRKTPL